MLPLTMIPMNDARVNVTCKKEKRGGRGGGLLSRRYVESINKCAYDGIEICIAQITDADYARAERIYVNSRI